MDHDQLEELTCAIAEKKLNHGPQPAELHYPCPGTGGNFQGIFIYDAPFCAMWMRHHMDRLPATAGLDNLYRLQDERGHICRQFLQNGRPKWLGEHPIAFSLHILSWVEWAIFKSHGDRERLARVYPHLRALHAFNRAHYRGPEGLYFADPFSSMDNLPRWPRDWTGDDIGMPLRREHIADDDTISEKYLLTRVGQRQFSWNIQGRYIDLSANMALDCRCLGDIAEALGRDQEAADWRQEQAELGALINERMWSDELGCYCDLGFDAIVPRRHIGGFWTMLAGIVPPDRLARQCADLVDPQTFGRPMPVPTLAADDPDYDPAGGYWLGSSWPPTTYMVLMGLRACGEHDLARRLGRQALAVVAHTAAEAGTLFENYAPEGQGRGTPSQRDFCGWSGLFTVGIIRDVLEEGSTFSSG